jgi:predicted nucleic acid-binding protein
MTVVVDASVAVSALVDASDDGRWAAGVVSRQDVVAPHLLPVEIVSALRGLARDGTISPVLARDALDVAAVWAVELYPLGSLARRVWDLRDTVTAYDAWYVALAELHGVPLATRDRRLAAASGPRCEFLLPT